MQIQVPIQGVEALNSMILTRSEEGEEYSMRGFDIVATDIEGNDWWYETFFYDENDAHTFASLLYSIGSFTPNKWNIVPKRGIPDYVLDPQRPKFN